MNVGELIRERERLLAVIEEAKTARTKLRQINVVIAMYGHDEKVDLVMEPTGEPRPPVALVPCPDCGKEVKPQGMGVHQRRMHGKVGATKKKAS